MKIGLISLGCPRNLVDSELIAGSLRAQGHSVEDFADTVDVGIVNTCAFVEDARRESIEVIMQAVSLKNEGRMKYLIVAGCLPQGYYRELARELREVDAFVGTSDFPKIPQIIKGLRGHAQESVVSRDLTYLADESSARHLLTPGHYAYVKISEGCSNSCSYCIISRLRGNFRSRRLESVVREVERIAGQFKTKEINIIGQDTTMYGIDIYGKPLLHELLRRLSGLDTSVRWIRLLYTHPAHYSSELIETIAHEEKMCKYVDLPLQHSSDRILKRMNRNTTRADAERLIGTLRTKIKGLAIRTSIIVGFPGETDADFAGLLEFVRDAKFERLGAFIYSREEGTKAYAFEGQVEEKVKKERFDELMRTQRSVSEELNKNLLGREVDVLIDERGEEEGVFLGRTHADAPEVDGIVYVRGGGLRVGDWRRVRIVDTLEYDLVGEIA